MALRADGLSRPFEKNSFDHLGVTEKRLASGEARHAAGFGFRSKPAHGHAEPACDDVQR